jgi:hypothetical protein
MKKCLFIFCSILIIKIGFFLKISNAQQYEIDTDRPGGDYISFNLDNPNPSLCYSECIKDSRCKAFTYVKPGVQSNKAKCWLKTTAPAAKHSSCCISWVKNSSEYDDVVVSFCKSYADKAVLHAQSLRNYKCQMENNYNRWRTGYNFHYDWCLNNPQNMATKEANGRQAWIEAKCPNAAIHIKCDEYAKTAVNQNNSNLNMKCGFSENDPMWNSNYFHHYNWCSGAKAPKNLIESSTRLRQEMLNKCMLGKNSTLILKDDDNDNIDDSLEQRLAEKYAPVIYHSSDETNFPTNVDWF